MEKEKTKITKEELEQLDRNLVRFFDMTGWTFDTEEAQAASKLFKEDLKGE